MEKNVSIIDGSGKLIGTTYPKRAKGLVKSGRARYVSCESKDTICLTCPLDKMEDNTMTDNSLDVAITETNNAAEGAVFVETAKETCTPSAEYALRMLECIAKDTDVIKCAVENASPAKIDDVVKLIEAR